jgi:TPR repeat protein
LACAQANLGMFYLRGIGCEQDFAKAQHWCRRAAEQNDSVGALALGVIHEHGFGTDRDLAIAARWYARGAELGNDAAATALGLLHLDGLGVEKNLVTARKLMAGPASRGDALAKKGMTELYAILESEAANDPGQRDTINAGLASAGPDSQPGGHQSRYHA